MITRIGWVALAVLASASPAALADDAPRGGAPATGKEDDPVVVLLGKLKDTQEFEVRVEGLKEAKSSDDARLVPAIAKLMKAPESAIRLAAVEALGARASAETKKKAAAALGERLKAIGAVVEKESAAKDEMIAVARALHDLAQPSSIDVLLDGLEDHPDLDVVEARAMAVGNIPDAKAIESLVDRMSRGRRDGGGGVRGRLARALVYATGVQLGGDPDVWRKWWYGAKAHFDFENAAQRREKERAEQDAKKAAKKGGKGDGKDGGTGKRDGGMDDKPDGGMDDKGKTGDGMGDGAPGESGAK